MNYKPHFNQELEIEVLTFLFHNQKKPSDYELTENHFYFSNHVNLVLALEKNITLMDLWDEETRKKINLNNELFDTLCERFASESGIMTAIGGLKKLEKRNNGIRQALIDLKALNDPLTEIDLSEEESENFILDPQELFETVPQEWAKIKPIRMRFKDLRQRLFSFNKGEVCGVIGRSGVGKTAFGYQLGETIAREQDEKFLFWSGEMSKSAIIKRIAMINFYIDNPTATNQQSGRWFFDNAKNNPDFAFNHIPDNMILIEKSMKWEGLKKLFIQACKTHRDIGTIVIDYLQLIPTENINRRVEVGAIAKELKTIAKELNVRVIPLIQTTRDGQDGFEPVKMHHCKESGEIEEALDSGIGIWKDKDDSCINVDIIKSRENGGGGKFQMAKHGVYFTDKLTQFEDIGRN